MSIKFKISALNIQFKLAQVTLELDKQITFITGPTSVGKSSILRIIDWCLGADLVVVPALRAELVSSNLRLETEDFDVLLERELGHTPVRATWIDSSGEVFSVIAPIHPKDDQPPIFGDNIFGISDLMFYFLGGQPVWVTQSKFQDDTKLVRLSFRDLFWYCYLRQDQLDNDFFRLLVNEPWMYNKGRDVQRYLFGYHSAKFDELQKELHALLDQKRADRLAAEQLRQFLAEFGYDSEASINKRIDIADLELKKNLSEREMSRQELMSQTHFADELRNQLRSLIVVINQTIDTITDSERLTSEFVGLRAELLSSKLKLNRASSAQSIMREIDFHSCPSCGSHLVVKPTSDECNLCQHALHKHSKEDGLADAQILAKDIFDRADELQDSINRHRLKSRDSRQKLAELQSRKSALDGRLAQELEAYDSIFVANTRKIDQEIAIQTERIVHLKKLLKMPQAVEKLESAADSAETRIKALRRAIEDEKSAFTEADRLVKKLETIYLKCLLQTGVPGITAADRVVINRTTWVPEIWPNGEQMHKWGYATAGAGGKTTLLKICYALAFHMVAASEQLPMPGILIIDSAMKNLAGSENLVYVTAFYELLFEQAATTLKNHQIILSDSTYFAAIDADVDNHFINESTPLVPYYSGP